jgi:hypothetical protein
MIVVEVNIKILTVLLSQIASKIYKNNLNLKKDEEINGIMIFLEEVALALERRLH